MVDQSNAQVAPIGHNSQFIFLDTTADDQLVGAKVCSQIVCRSESTLAKDRVYGTGIPFVKFGRSVRYRVGDIRAEIAKRRRISTSAADCVTATHTKARAKPPSGKKRTPPDDVERQRKGRREGVRNMP